MSSFSITELFGKIRAPFQEKEGTPFDSLLGLCGQVSSTVGGWIDEVTTSKPTAVTVQNFPKLIESSIVEEAAREKQNHAFVLSPERVKVQADALFGSDIRRVST